MLDFGLGFDRAGELIEARLDTNHIENCHVPDVKTKTVKAKLVAVLKHTFFVYGSKVKTRYCILFAYLALMTFFDCFEKILIEMFTLRKVS